ncbi:MAG: hypothetical protein H0W81_03665 [Chloroflexi bacterium]|nr:hypothetical protein [Chloroflexota bacterium]
MLAGAHDPHYTGAWRAPDLTGQYMDAAYLRELFDEPAALLYLVWSLVRTIDDAVNPDEPTTMREACTQADALITEVATVLDGAEETEIVRTLVRLRGHLENDEHGTALSTDAEAARSLLKNLVNTFFHDRLVALPTIGRLHRAPAGRVRAGRRRVGRGSALIRLARRRAVLAPCA